MLTSSIMARETTHRAPTRTRIRGHESLEDNIQVQADARVGGTRSGSLQYGASNVIELFIPVSICMLIVVTTMKATDNYRYSSKTSNWYIQMMFTDQSVDTGTRVWQSFANAFMMLLMIAAMTTVLIVLYKFRCYKTIHGWLILSSLTLLFMFAIMYVAEILKVYNIAMDNYTLAIFIWNFGVVGMICIHWKGPLLLQQGYLIVISALLALVFIRSLPDWTTWTVLAIVSIWDLVAVLCPNGPLRILVETAQERNESIFPALIYSSTMIWEVYTTVIASTNRNHHPVEIEYEDGARPPEVAFARVARSDSDSWSRQVVRSAPNSSIDAIELSPNLRQSNDGRTMTDQSMEEERGVKLGLGDFVFYSLLVGRASSYGDWTITLSCYVSILVGLCLTLSLLAIFRKALPALPISIAFGLSAFFLSFVFVVPFASRLAIDQVFV